MPAEDAVPTVPRAEPARVRPPCFCPGRKARCADSGCEYGPRGVPFNTAFHCRVCWLYHNDAAARERWGGPPLPDADGSRLSMANGRPGEARQLKGLECRHNLGPAGGQARCGSCGPGKFLKLFRCSVFGTCTVDPTRRAKAEDGVEIASCGGCTKWQARTKTRDVGSVQMGAVAGMILPEAPAPDGDPGEALPPISWAVGVTTVPERRDDLLPRTVHSLARSGFDPSTMWFFVDGAGSPEDVAWWHNRWGRRVVLRWPNVRCAGSWILALAELYLRNPLADRFAVFQDDLICSRNLRAYLECCPFPDKGYLNLYTFASNQVRFPRVVDGSPAQLLGWCESNQLGRGAVGLVFDRAGAITLLSSRHLWKRAENPDRGHKAIDGGIVQAMQEAGWREWVHNPSLVQHTGEESAVGNLPHAAAPSFRGEGFDLMDLVPESASQRRARR